MNESRTRQSVFEPGKADDFFEIAGLPPFDPGGTAAFSRAQALWLAEFSRLVYLPAASGGDTGVSRRTRQTVLRRLNLGWSEVPGALPAPARDRVALFRSRTSGCAALVFRGTIEVLDMASDSLVPAVRWPGPGHVHLGFKLALDGLWPQVESWLRELHEPVFLAGHSLGGALATLAAARCLADPRLPDPAGLYTCGSPRVGDAAFGRSLDGLLHCRIVNDRDVVTTVPPPLSLPGLPVYRHTGRLHRLGPAGWVTGRTAAAESRASRNPAGALMRFAASARRLASLIRKPGSALPQALLDHAPVNYVARLERSVAPAASPS